MPRDTRPPIAFLAPAGVVLFLLVTVGPFAFGKARPTVLQSAAPGVSRTCPCRQAMLFDSGTPAPWSQSLLGYTELHTNLPGGHALRRFKDAHHRAWMG